MKKQSRRYFIGQGFIGQGFGSSPIRKVRSARVAAALAAAIGIGGGFHAASAATDTWTGLGANNNFSTPGNWNPGAPNTGDDVLFTAAAATVKTTNIDTPVTLDSMAFQQGAASWTVSGSAITLTPSVSGALTLIVPKTAGTSLTAITSNIILGANQSWATIGMASATPNLSFGGAISLGANTLTLFASTGATNTINATFTGAFSGTGQIVRDPASGTVALLGSSPNWSGGMTVYGGTLVAGTDQALGTGTITISPSVITATGAPASVSMQTAVSRSFANNFFLNDPTTGNWVFTNIGATTANPAVTYTFNGALTLAGGGTRVMTAQNANTATFNQPIGESGGSAALQLATPGSGSGTGTYNFNATNTYSGLTTIWAGVLNLNAAQSGAFIQGTGTTSTINLNAAMNGASFTASAGTLSIAFPQSNANFFIAGGTLVGKVQSTFSNTVTATSGNVTLAVDAVGTVGNITSGPIGTGQLNLNLVSNLSGGSTVNIGTSNPIVVGTARTVLNPINVSGTGNVQFGNSSNSYQFYNLLAPVSFSSTSVAIIENGSIVTFAGGITAGGGLGFGVANNGNLNGGAALLPTANPGISGLTQIFNEVIVAGNDSALGSSIIVFQQSSFGALATPQGQTRNIANDIQFNSTNAQFGGKAVAGTTFNGTYSGTLNLSGNLNFNAGTGNSVSIFVDSAGSGATLSPTIVNAVSPINGNGYALVKTGGGTLNVFNNQNSWTAVTVTAGTLGVHTDSVPTDISLTTNGTVQFNQDTDGTYTGTISGSGNVSKIGAGTVTLTANNGQVYTTSISAGVLSVSSDAQLGADGSAGGVWTQFNAAGSGFTAAPSVIISGAGTGATATAYLGVTTLAISTRGTGYTGAPTLTFSTPQLPGGVQASGTATITGTTISGVTITNPGSGYTSLPTITLSGGGASTEGVVSATAMTIESLLTTPGTGYAGLPLPSINLSGGGGTGEAAQVGLIGLLNLDGGTLQTNQPLTSARNVLLTNTTSAIDTDGNNATFSGTFFGTGSLAKIGAGKLTLSGNSTTTGALSPNAGTLEVTGALSIGSLGGNGSGALSIPGGSIAVGSRGTAGANVADLSSLSITGGGKLDLNNNELIVNYTGSSPAATIRGYLVSGFSGGAWNGPGIATLAAHNDATMHTALGYADNGSSVTVKYTYYGDSDLDGSVTTADFRDFLNGLTSGGSTWQQGDYTYDGVVDLGNDFNLFLINYLSQGGALGDLAPIIAGDEQLSAYQKAELLSVVPEPTIAGLLAIACGVMVSRRRRTRTAAELVRTQ